MEKLITGCEDCPLCCFDVDFGFYCSHPEFEDKIMVIERDSEEGLITPDFCPLDENPLMLKKKMWQIFENFWLKEN
jgi:hypothetical protein